MLKQTILAILVLLLLPLSVGADNDEEYTAPEAWAPEVDQPASLPSFTTPRSPAPGAIWRDPITGMEFVWVPGGCYQMGCNSYQGEKPVHEVCLDGFWMGRYEVTNAQFRRYKADHKNYVYKKITLNGSTQPVVMVTWHEADGYARWLSSRSKGTFRLPTEAEWEYAARAGSTTRRYWGDSEGPACQYANVNDATAKRAFHSNTTHFSCDDGYKVTAPVGSFRPNRYGLYDMLGNVWEWCQDWYNERGYTKHSHRNPVYTAKGSERIVRGGGWCQAPGDVRTTVRGWFDPGKRNNSIGFRLVRTQ